MLYFELSFRIVVLWEHKWLNLATSINQELKKENPVKREEWELCPTITLERPPTPEHAIIMLFILFQNFIRALFLMDYTVLIHTWRDLKAEAVVGNEERRSIFFPYLLRDEHK